MSTEHHADPVTDPEAEGLPAYADDDSFADPGRDSARVADGPSPAALPTDRPLGVTEFGTTANEQREGEPLEDRLRREEPDVVERAVDDEAGRLVEPDEGAHTDDEPDAIAFERGTGGATAEEQAVHVVRDLA
ncbi:DUF5709 domain-containing protein [Cryptosporangium aurantiacum]|uniref:DUF5709 domain-containing protein n=1 Tax=Cryptosporangium aurantiacum TaxID=134849 RepID=A0A1M7RMZ6_9ACTN|nr:DUF5709 domain-containing protein [Cryptosporangium aurantiacum]SHN47589.1 hypothetical protein SAMN05443668_12549 [Cryptosporangium aurantiacum]